MTDKLPTVQSKPRWSPLQVPANRLVVFGGAAIVLSVLIFALYSFTATSGNTPAQVGIAMHTARLESVLLEQREQAQSQLETSVAEADELAQSLSPEVLASATGVVFTSTLAEAEILLQRRSEMSVVEASRLEERLSQAQGDVIAKEACYADLLADLTNLFEGRHGAVVLKDVEEGNTLVSFHAEEMFTAASTYKVYSAYSMINAVESGERPWSSPLAGTTLEECFTRMLTYSDNECPLAWFHQVGYELVDSQAQELGAVSTSVARDSLKTNAMDLATALWALQATDVITDDSRDRMVTLMQGQETRDGIPAAIEPEHGVVADKVGYLDALLHDVAIISTDKGDYILVILTEHSSWEIIADATRLVYEYI